MGAVGRQFKDRSLDRRFRRDGYVVVPAMSPKRIRAALDVFERIDSGIGAGHYVSIHSESDDYKQQVDAALREILWEPCDQLLADHRCLVAAMTVKPPTGPTTVPLHQDWNTIEESRCAGLTCWIPLTPVTELEGLMSVLPGSHHYMGGLRGSPGFPAPYQSISDQIEAELLVDVPVAVGDVMLMDARVLHTTGPNRSGRTRVAAYVNAIPNRAQPVHYYRHEDGRVEGYEVDQAFFTSFSIGQRPSGRVFTEIDCYERPPISMEELRRRHRRARRRIRIPTVS